MAQCKLSPQEFIKNAFTPQIAVYCSTMVDDICLKNNLSFIELLQPFCTLASDVHLQETNGSVMTVHNLKVKFVDIHFRPPQTTLARKHLNTCVRQSYDSKSSSFQIGDLTLDIPSSTPWFESWRELFLQMQYPSDHEFTKHFLACMLVVASHEPNCIDSMNGLNQSLNQLQNVANRLPKWFSLPILRYYVVLHDNMSGSSEKASQCLETLKVSYGANNCFLLRINSGPVAQVDTNLTDMWSPHISSIFGSSNVARGTPDVSPSTVTIFEQTVAENESTDSKTTLSYHPLSPTTENLKSNNFLDVKTDLPQPVTNYGMHLTSEDIEQIKKLVSEFCINSLVPYIEKQIQGLNDALTNKKGVSKSLLSATKRWFAPSKIGSNNGAANLPVYAYDALELQMRKLGDLYFMFSNYSAAFSVYHAAKRDFNADQAWLYYAGALEMASLSSFMANEIVKKTYEYMEESIITYLNVCKLPHFATRATLLSFECLKTNSLHGEAAHQLIRMTSEDSDLLSALLLEQAAYCFLNCNRPQMVRKYAFHMVLTGHRYSKATQKEHALRCYKQALEIYQHKGWTFAEDHIYYTIGKLSSGLNFLKEAASSFSMLLSTESKQSVEQQTIFFQDYLNTQEMLRKSLNPSPVPILILPTLNSALTKILVGPTLPLSIPGKIPASGIVFENCCDDVEVSKKWAKLEESVVQEAQGSLPLLFKPITTLYTKTNLNNINLTAIMTELVQVSIKLQNPIGINLHLKDTYLIWNLKHEDGTVYTNETDSSNKLDKFIKTHILKSIVLPASSTQEVVLSLTPLAMGKLHLIGLFYGVLNGENQENVIVGKQMFDLNKMEYVKKDQANENSSDLGLPITITSPAPCLQVYFSEISLEVLCDEIQCTTMEMRNVGVGPLRKVYIITSTPNFISTCEFSSKLKGENQERKSKNITHVPLPHGTLEPGQAHSVNIWMKAPRTIGPTCIDLLIYYENCDTTSSSRYRVVRHVWNLTVENSLDLNCTTTESFKSKRIKELIFSLKVVNSSKPKIEPISIITEISILSASLLSSCWKLKNLENVTINNIPKLDPQQSASLLLKVQQHLTKNKNNFSQVSLGKDRVKSSAVYLDFAERADEEMVSSANNYVEDTVTTEGELISTSCKEREGILFLEWCAHVIDDTGIQRKLNGQSHAVIEKLHTNKTKKESREAVIFIEPNPLSIMQTTKISKDDGKFEKLKYQVSMCIIHSSHAVHDFRTNKLCIVPVKIYLYNDSTVQSIVTLKTISSSSLSTHSSRPNLFHPNPSKDYKWVGFSNISKTIEKLSSVIVVLKVAVTSPGVYDLAGRLELWCQNNLNEKAVLQNLRAMCCLTVRDTSR